MSKAPNQDGASNKRRGRPSISEGQDTVPVTIRLTEPQREKLGKLGGAQWVRDRIDRAKVPSE